MKYEINLAKHIIPVLIPVLLVQQVYSYVTTTTYEDVVESRTNIQDLKDQLAEAESEAKEIYNDYCDDSGKCGEVQEQTWSTTLRDVLGLWDCRVTNTKHKFPKDNITFDAVDIACTKGESFPVYVPEWKNEYIVESIWYGTNLGNYIVLKHSNYRFVYWHTKAREWLKVGDRIVPGISDMLIGYTDLSWYQNTNYHVHFELWDEWENINGRFMVGDKKIVQWDSKKLLDKRKWNFGWKQKYYFTHYDLWDVSQNDAAPCNGASWLDLCHLEKNGTRTMALTVDIRNQLGIKFGDRVRLSWDEWCSGEYEVHDEMNIRFRENCIVRPWTPYCIKGDIPSKEGWACSITKL